MWKLLVEESCIRVKIYSMNKEENIKKVSTESYKGVRDFYPKDWLFQKWLF
jgi:hypothetical protein